MPKSTFSSWPSFSDRECETISRVLRSNKVNYWTGNECRTFEREFAQWTGAKYAITLANGAVALEVALRALSIGKGDEVIVTPRTFIASVACVVNVGATPIFADVCRDSGNICAATIAKVLSPQTKALICVHLGGMPCEMDAIMTLANQQNLKVIEDCAQAHGARYQGRPVGALGHIGAWSFCQDKNITTGGEGGMVTTNDEGLWQKMWSYKDNGRIPEELMGNNASANRFLWCRGSFGTNYRMTEMQAAIGRIQLEKISQWVSLRRRNARLLAEVCSQFPLLRVPDTPKGFEHAYYRFSAFVETKYLAPGWSRDRIIDEINALGVPCFVGPCPEVYLEEAFADTNFRPAERLPVARELGETSLVFLVHPTLTEDEMKTICSLLRGVFAQASR